MPTPSSRKISSSVWSPSPAVVVGPAVQMRKAVTNAQDNWLTRVQAMEMAFDAQIQQGRLAGGGVAELRGNGQLLRRDLLEACGGFNEETVNRRPGSELPVVVAGGSHRHPLESTGPGRGG